MKNSKSIEKRISIIEERNRNVEIDKSWETSIARRLLLVIFTYLAIGTYMFYAGLPKPWLNAIVPSVGFMLSTLTLPIFKRLWINFYNK